MRRTASKAMGEITAGVLSCALRPALAARSARTKKPAAGMDPTRRFQNQARLASLLIKLVVSAIRVSLENTGISIQMALGVLAGAITGVIEHCCRRRRATERAVIADICPYPAGLGLAPRQNRHRGVIAMQALSRQHMGFDQAIERLQHADVGPDLIGQGRQAHLDTLTGEAFALPVERLMLAELLEQDHGQQARSGPAAGNRMERCRWLGDLLAFPAGEFLPHRLDYLPLARNAFQVSVMVSPSLASLVEPQQVHALGAGTTTRSRGR